MNRPDLPRAGVSASLLLLLASCGAEEVTDFRAQLGGEWVSFENVETQVLGTKSEFLATCGEQDPDPTRLGDERRLCVVLELTLGQLNSQNEGRAFPIKGRARFTEASPDWRPDFTPDTTHDPGIRNAWAVLYCAQAPRPDAVTQDVRGQLLYTRASDTRLEGRVQLATMGGLGGSACGTSTGEAVFDFPFKADY